MGPPLASCKALIAEIEAGEPAEPMFDAKVKVLGEYIDHHVREEREDIFAKARASKKLELVPLRDAFETRKSGLMAGMAAESV